MYNHTPSTTSRHATNVTFSTARAVGDALPMRMREARRWLLWRSVSRSGEGQKPSKIPYYVDGHARQGVLDAPEDRCRLVTFETACTAFTAAPGVYAGLGFALGPDEDGQYWQGIDLDDTAGRPELEALIDHLPGYVESSPSGKGVHAIGYGRAFPTLGSNTTGIEAYCRARFFTVTGDKIKGELTDLATFVDTQLKPRHTPPRPPSSGQPQAAGGKTVQAGGGDLSIFAHVNREALARLERWVPALFPDARPYHDGFRLSSQALGRNLEEDLSLLPTGIRDFGEERGMTPIDVVLAWGPVGTPREAAHWLCRQLNIDPAPLTLRSGGTRAAIAVAPATSEHDWTPPQPLPRALLPVAAFDMSLLPAALRGWVHDIAERMQCPPDFPAVGAIVGLSSVIGRKAVIHPKRYDDWSVVPNLWGMIIGRPGIMKSPALSAVLAPLEQMQHEASRAYNRTQQEHVHAEKLHSMLQQTAEAKAKKLVSEGKRDEAQRLLREAAVPADSEVPRLRRYKVTDTSHEALGEILMENPWGTLAYRDELYGLLSTLDKPGQESARTFFLQGYDGTQSYTFDRIGRGRNRHIEAVCLAMLGGIQPGNLKGYIRAAVVEGRGDDGLLQRFGMMVWPDVHTEWKNVDRWPDTPAKRHAFEIFRRLDSLPPGPDAGPAAYRFAPAAQEACDAWRETLELRLRRNTLAPALESHLSKYRKLVPALALISALADGEETVSETAFNRALAWAVYLETHAERVYNAGANAALDSAAALLAKIHAGVLRDGFKPSDVYLKGWSGLSDPMLVADAARVLCDLGHLRRCESQPGPTGGRPSITYRINPATRKSD